MKIYVNICDKQYKFPLNSNVFNILHMKNAKTGDHPNSCKNKKIEKFYKNLLTNEKIHFIMI